MAVPDKPPLAGQQLRKQLARESVGVYGYGRTGREVVNALRPLAETIHVFEDNREQVSDPVDDIEWSFSDHSLDGVDRLITSPGIPIDNPVLKEARKRGIDVWGEIELAYRLLESGRIWAITGTNGKSTCTELAGAFLRAQKDTPISVCGNRGTPMIQAVTDEQTYSDYVVEISSFQVEGMDSFRADAVLLTNLGDDHIDRHGTMEEYHRLKWELVRRVLPSGRAVIPLEETMEPEPAMKFPNEFVEFSSREVWGLDFVVQWRDEGLRLGEHQIERDRFPLSLQLFPQNILSVIGLVLDRPERGIVEGAMGHFDPLPHRADLIEGTGDVRVVDDSKSTNPDSVESLVENMDDPYRLLLGGAGKDGDYSKLFALLGEHPPECLVFCGEDGLVEQLKSLAEQSALEYEVADEWERAVKQIVEATADGEWVLLSPGGTSFDAFENYKERGRKFCEWVREAVGQ